MEAPVWAPMIMVVSNKQPLQRKRRGVIMNTITTDTTTVIPTINTSTTKSYKAPSLSAQFVYDEVISFMRHKGCKHMMLHQGDPKPQCFSCNNKHGACNNPCIISSMSPTLHDWLVCHLGSKVQGQLTKHSLLLAEFQLIHDVYPMSAWEEEFSLLADRYRLTYYHQVR